MRGDDSRARGNARAPPHPLLRWLVFCVRLPCAACSRMLCFSSSRWPLVVSSGTAGALPGPLWLWFSSGTGLMDLASGFVIMLLRFLSRENEERDGAVPTERSHGRA